MGRRSRTQITKELAIKIVGKLEAVDVTEKGDERDEYVVSHEGVIAAQFGIRRGSRRDAGHDHIAGELGLGSNFAKQRGQCPKSCDDYLRQIDAVQE